VIIQQIENNFLVPKIMQKTAGLNPIISIVVLMIGFSIGGILGALLSIPVATAGMVIVEDMLNKKYMSSGKSSEE
jgi:predicted PurR-regulated permease PerM